MISLTDKDFHGDNKVGTWLFSKWEKKFVEKFTPKIPRQIETYHLTMSTVFWSLAIIAFGYLAKQVNIHFLWGTSIMIIGQYLTDLFDGAVGRYRKTGLIRWGYYMDHLLDYIFLCSILIGYSFLFNDRFNTLFFILAIFGAFMVNSYLSFASTNEFKISYLRIGPTEIRLLFIIINTLLIFFHKTYLIGLLPGVMIFSLVGLCRVVYDTQKEIWELDMKNKKTLD